MTWNSRGGAIAIADMTTTHIRNCMVWIEAHDRIDISEYFCEAYDRFRIELENRGELSVSARK